MNTDIVIGFVLGIVAAAALAGVTDDDIGYVGSALLGLAALACIVAAFVLAFWGYLKWLM